MDAEILKRIQTNLDTRDKRFMFIKILWPRMVHRVDLEGATLDFSVRLYLEFKKAGLINDLNHSLSTYFD